MTAVDASYPVAAPKRSFFQRNPILRRLLKHKAFMVGAILFVVVAFVAIFAGVLTDADPNRMAVRFRSRPPSADFWFGTDNLGRSILARIFYGAQLSLGIGLAVVIMNAVFGVALGAASTRQGEDERRRAAHPRAGNPPHSAGGQGPAERVA